MLRDTLDGVGNRVAVGVRCTTGLRDGVAGSVRTLGVLRDTLGVLRDTVDGVGIRLGVWLMRGVDDDRVTVGRGDDEMDGRARDEIAGERETEALGLLGRAIAVRLGLRLEEEIRGAEDDRWTMPLDREGLTLGDRRMLLLDDRDGVLRE
ncbi:MAG: hypothetical protein JXA69_09120 [Phycisphaerae bacterium]|nr:hypothetical protein [Phycisphaerae bacterium]